jgi:hypothetical protein
MAAAPDVKPRVRALPEAPPWTATTIEYLLRQKLVYVSGHRHLYELSGDAVGFRFGSPEHGNRVDPLLFAEDSTLYRLTLLRRPTARFTQSEVLAVAASFRVTGSAGQSGMDTRPTRARSGSTSGLRHGERVGDSNWP